LNLSEEEYMRELINPSGNELAKETGFVSSIDRRVPDLS